MFDPDSSLELDNTETRSQETGKVCYSTFYGSLIRISTFVRDTEFVDIKPLKDFREHGGREILKIRFKIEQPYGKLVAINSVSGYSCCDTIYDGGRVYSVAQIT